jgi:hypothetical protein
LARVGPGVLFGVLLGGLLGAFGTPWGHFGLPWSHLGPPWPAMVCCGMSLGVHFVRLGRLFSHLLLKMLARMRKHTFFYTFF